MQNKYFSLVEKLFRGEVILLELDGTQSFETVRTAISKEKRRQEEGLLAFEMPVENTRLSMEKVSGNKCKVKFRKVREPFTILAAKEAENEPTD